MMITMVIIKKYAIVNTPNLLTRCFVCFFQSKDGNREHFKYLWGSTLLYVDFYYYSWSHFTEWFIGPSLELSYG